MSKSNVPTSSLPISGTGFPNIADTAIVPVPLIADYAAVGFTTLDMTYCGLRSISPLHIDYLRDMGGTEPQYFAHRLRTLASTAGSPGNCSPISNYR